MVAIAGLVRDRDLGVYVLGNLDHVEVRHALMYRVLDLYLAPNDVRDWSAEVKALYDGIVAGMDAQRIAAEEGRVEGTAPSHGLSAYAGRYEAEGFEPVEVTESGGSLRIYRGPGLQGPLVHWHYDVFRAEWDARWRGTAAVTFETGPDGSVVALRSGGVRMVRVPETEGA